MSRTEDSFPVRVDRRSFLRSAAGATAGLLTGSTALAASRAPLAFQLFGVRSAAILDLPGTLRRVASLGYGEVELVSFPGYAANTPRDGFGPLAGMRPADIRLAIQGAGLSVESCHFKLLQLEGNELGPSLDWAHGVGLREIIVSDISPGQTRADWENNFARLDRAGDAVAHAGFSLGLHTPADVWRVFDDGRVFERMLQRIRPARLNVQLDLSSTLSRGVDPVQVLAQHGRRIHSLHLRDGFASAIPGDYVDALALGQGEIRWHPLLAAARRAGVRRYIVEMVSRNPATDPFEALRISAQFLRSA